MNAHITRSAQVCVAPGFGALNRCNYAASLISTLKPWRGPVEEEPVLHFLLAFFRSQNSSSPVTSYLFEGPSCSQEQSSGLPDLTWPHYCTNEEDEGHAKLCSVCSHMWVRHPTKARREECWELASLSSSWKGKKVDLRVLSWGDPTSYPDTCWIPKDGWCWPRPSHSQFNRCACRRP